MINDREYTALQFETSDSLENVTTEMTALTNTTTTIIVTTNTLTNATSSVPPNGLSEGVIAGIVIGAIVGVIGLFFLVFIIYKYRQCFVDMLHKDSEPSTNHSVPAKPSNPQPNVTYAPEHEYLTVNTFPSSKNQQSDGTNKTK